MNLNELANFLHPGKPFPVIMSIAGNMISGRLTAKQLLERLGKIARNRESISIKCT
jgi:hypothetical protein